MESRPQSNTREQRLLEDAAVRAECNQAGMGQQTKSRWGAAKRREMLIDRLPDYTGRVQFFRIWIIDEDIEN